MHAPDRKTSLVMLHGLFGPLDYFDPASLLPHLDVHCPSLPGYGSVPPLPEREVTLEALAGEMVDRIRREPAGPVWLLGHSLGGAVAMLVAHTAPELVSGIVNVEGNFTLKDAFWTGRIASLPAEAWSAEYDAMKADPPGWLRRAGIDPTPERAARAAHILGYQPAPVVRAVARALVHGTGDASYLERVRAVVERGVPVALVAGARSAAAWDVPAWVRDASRTYRVQPGVGHMMMLEDPEGFCRIVGEVVPAQGPGR
ncbi:MAG: alpha/beta fold hydrolase [Gemmatimonadota bacterium]